MFDTLIKNGTLIDGTGAPRFTSDLGIRDGRIAEIGELKEADAAEVVDAAGLIVAPGYIDPHTHYDAQLHWDPHCTNSGTHGSTTVVIGNCGFGFAPCRAADRDRYMMMMEQTEQIPFDAMKAGLPWSWETFPEWLENLRRIPKGVNVAMFVPMNPLMIYVMGIEAAKSRPATEEERATMRALLREGMEAGAAGFAFTWLGPNNNHTDGDGTPMPSDVMDIEEAYNLATVLREMDRGVIMADTDIPGISRRRDVCEELARISGRPIFHNIIQVLPDSDAYLETLSWLDQCAADGLQMYSQSFVSRTWLQFTMENYYSWDVLPVFRHFTEASAERRRELVASAEYRERIAREYDFDIPQHGATKFYEFTLVSAHGNEYFAPYEGQTITEIATALGSNVIDAFFDILTTTDLEAEFTHLTRGVTDASVVGPVIEHPRVLAGGSDGGAHIRFQQSGQWTTDLLTWLGRDSGVLSLETIHAKLSGLPAELLGFTDRGILKVGNAADLVIYDIDELGYRHGRYDTVNDLPDGSWRHFVGVQGLRRVYVNGVVTMIDGKPTQNYPGELLIGPTLTAASAEVDPTRGQTAAVVQQGTGPDL